MRKILFLVGVIAPACLVFNVAQANTDHVVISQVQITGGSGLTGNDFVELYNPTANDIDIKSWKLAKTSSTGTEGSLATVSSSDKTTLIKAHGFYLFASFSGINPDALRSSFSISDDNAIALKNTTGSIIDSVGWGQSASSFVEGSVFVDFTKADANKSIERLPGSDAGNGTDSNNNSLDFFKTDSHPRNSSSPIAPALESVPPPVDQTTPPVDQTPPSDATPVPPTDSSPPPIYSSDILISELMPNPDGPDDGEEWVELFNNSNQDVDLSGWILDDAATTAAIGSSAYTIPDQTTIKAQDYLAIDLPTGSFALNNTSGDTLRLFWPNQTLFKQVSYTETAKIDQAYALKMQEGVYAWTEFPTKDAANVFTEAPAGITSDAETKIKLNEIFPNPAGPDSGAEWVELLNTGTEPIYLHNWTLDDGMAGTPIGSSAYKIQSPTVPPGGLAVLVIPAGKFAMNNSGTETVRLFNENNILIDSVTYDTAQEGMSYALVAGNWIWTIPTPNALNTVAEAPAETPNLLINELFPEPERKSDQEEFIEIKNLSDKAVDLDGWQLADLSTKYTIHSQILAPAGLLVVKKSESGISLNNSGKEQVTLTDPKQVIVSAVEYEDAPTGQSYNLTEAGTYAWSARLTPGQPNQIRLAVAEVSKPAVTKAVAATLPEVPAPAVEDVSQVGQVGEVSGASVSPLMVPPPTPVATDPGLWWILAASFAINMGFCYILVRLMSKHNANVANGHANNSNGSHDSHNIS